MRRCYLLLSKAWVACLLLLLAPGQSAARVLDPAFTETVFVASPELMLATGLAWAPDGSNRLFVTLQRGEIRIIKNGVLLPTSFDSVKPLNFCSECGLIGIAFDPNFRANQYVYIFVSVSLAEQQIIRYRAAGDVGVEKTVIIAGLPTDADNHNGGGVGFGPDGKLYWAVGDLGISAGVNDDRVSLAAKVGRANPDGTAPGDNPFVDGAGPNADHIWARGFRNPFTLTFQPASGRLWVNVVGDVYEQIFVVGRGDHGGWTDFEVAPRTYLAPVIKYRTNGVDSRNILSAAMSGAVRAGGVVTFTTDDSHRLLRGEKVTLSGVANAGFDGAFYVASVPSATTFTVAQGGPDAVSGGGTLTTLPQGGCVTGGAFYDATLFPAAYRGNFFYGDYNSHRLMRVTLDSGGNAVTSVDYWGDQVRGAVDVALGPDGALYYTGLSTGEILRASYNVNSQALVVSPTNLWLAEGESGVVMVRLARAPGAGGTMVAVARTAGDADIGVESGATLGFTDADWNVPRAVVVTAGRDGDSSDDAATLAVTAASLPGETANVRARDDNAPALVLSAHALAITEGQSGSLTVALSKAPAADLTVTVARLHGDGDVTIAAGATLTFTSANWSALQTATISAAQDQDIFDDSATVTIGAPGLSGRAVGVFVTDDEPHAAPVITSTPVTSAVVGVPYSYDLEATALPPPSFTMDSEVPGMLVHPFSGVLTWMPTAPGVVMVKVRASNDVLPDATQSFNITVTEAGVDAAVDAPADAPAPPDAGADSGAPDGPADAAVPDAAAPGRPDLAIDVSGARPDAPVPDGSLPDTSGAAPGDAGRADAGSPQVSLDAGASDRAGDRTSDAAAPRSGDSGCGCRVGGTGQEPGTVALVVLVGAALLSGSYRRRTQRGRGRRCTRAAPGSR